MTNEHHLLLASVETKLVESERQVESVINDVAAPTTDDDLLSGLYVLLKNIKEDLEIVRNINKSR